jgi:hypothetical protein
MTQPKTEPESSGGAGAGLNKKYGPFPMWAYLVAAGLGIFLFIWWRQKQAAPKTSTDPNATATDTTSASTLPPFINQVYTGTTPPAQPTPDTGTEGPPALEKLIDKPVTNVTTRSTSTWASLVKWSKMTNQTFTELNPTLASRFANTKKVIPKGTKIRVYTSTGMK